MMHSHFCFSTNQITWSWLLIQIHILNTKQWTSRSVGFFRSQLIWIYTVCKSRAYPDTAGQELINKQEAHGPQVAHLSDIATANMQMLCNIFPILSSQLMKRSSFKQFLLLKNIIYGMTVYGAWSSEQTLNHISIVGSMWNLVAIG